MTSRITLTSSLPRDLPSDAVTSSGKFLINLEGELLFAFFSKNKHCITICRSMIKYIKNPELYARFVFGCNRFAACSPGGMIQEESAYSIAAMPTSLSRCPRCRRYTSDEPDCLCPRCQTVLENAK